MPKALENMTETESIDYLQKLLETYIDLDKDLSKEYGHLVKEKESFPSSYLREKGEHDFEDLMLKAASYKFKAITLARKYNGLAADIKVELEFVRANFKLNISEEALKTKFEKITEGLRDAYVISKLEIKSLTKLNDRVQNFADSAEKLIKSFDGDEINFRRLADKKNKIMGFQ